MIDYSFSITITGVNRSYNFSISKKTYRITKIILACVFFGIIILSFSVYHLKSQVAQEQGKNQSIALQLKSNTEQWRKKNRSILENKQNIVQNYTKRIESYEKLLQTYASLEDIKINNTTQKFNEKTAFSPLELSSAEKEKMLRVIPNGYPVKHSTRISSRYGRRLHPIRKTWHFHKGIDLTAAVGEPIYATADGVVKFTGNKSGFGVTLILDHKYGFQTLFAHLHKNIKKRGDQIRKGDLIAFSGKSGVVTGAHLHYELIFNKKHINPIDFMRWQEDNYRYIFNKTKTIPWQFLTNLIRIQHIQEKASLQMDALSEGNLN